MSETIEPVREPASRNEAQAEERPAWQGTGAQDEDADQEQSEGDDDEEEEIPGLRWQARTEIQEPAGVEGKFEADRIRRERDSRRIRENVAGEPRGGLVAPHGSEEDRDEDESSAARHEMASSQVD